MSSLGLTRSKDLVHPDRWLVLRLWVIGADGSLTDYGMSIDDGSFSSHGVSVFVTHSRVLRRLFSWFSSQLCSVVGYASFTSHGVSVFVTRSSSMMRLDT